MKGWLQSKTIWVNIVLAVLLTLSNSSQPFIELFAADVQPLLTTWVAYAGVAANAVVRFFTAVGITVKTPVVPS